MNDKQIEQLSKRLEALEKRERERDLRWRRALLMVIAWIEKAWNVGERYRGR